MSDAPAHHIRLPPKKGQHRATGKPKGGHPEGSLAR